MTSYFTHKTPNSQTKSFLVVNRLLFLDHSNNVVFQEPNGNKHSSLV